MKRTHRWGGSDGDLAGLKPGKPTKFRQRPEKVEKPEDPLRPGDAKPVKGRPGFVYHPKDGRVLDVRGVPAGTMMLNAGATFTVPKMGYIITPEASQKTFQFPEGESRVLSCRMHFTEPRWDDGSPVMPGDMRGEQEGS